MVVTVTIKNLSEAVLDTPRQRTCWSPRAERRRHRPPVRSTRASPVVVGHGVIVHAPDGLLPVLVGFGGLLGGPLVVAVDAEPGVGPLGG